MKRKGLTFKIIILLIVSAAFVLAKFGRAGAQEFSPVQDKAQLSQSQSVQESTGEAKAAPSFGRKGDDSLMMPMLKLVGALLLVVVAIYGFLFVLKKMMGQGGGNGGKLIEVLESSALGPKKSVALVRYSDKAVLVGIADNAISVLAELDSAETQKIMQESQPGRTPAGFKGVLDSARGRLDTLGLNKFKAAILSGSKNKTQAA